MSSLKKLASQTAIYGLSSILARIINYALTPLHTYSLTNRADYGVVGEMYAYVTFVNIIYLYGMETAYFRNASKFKEEEKAYYSTAFTSILISTLILSLGFFALSPLILDALATNDPSGAKYYQSNYITWFVIIMGFDAITAIPFARLRQQNKPLKFAFIKLSNILINVFFNVFWLWFCPFWLSNHPDSIIQYAYLEENKVAYIFISNLIASAATLLFLYKEIITIKLKIEWEKLKPMFYYGFPLLFAGLAGMMNEFLGRIFLKYLLPGTIETNLAQLGIYNAAYKLSIFMTLVIQAFRMAAEPFFFSMSNAENAQKVYARVMTYFIIICLLIFLVVCLNIKLIAGIFIDERYQGGLFVVPVLLLASMFLGIYYNLSIWYKLSDKTSYSIYFTILGAIVTLVLNIIWIPIFGYEGSAWATLCCYFMMTVSCYFFGQKNYSIPYDIKRITIYFFVAMGLFFTNNYLNKELSLNNTLLGFFIDTIFILVFILFAYLYQKKDLNFFTKKSPGLPF